MIEKNLLGVLSTEENYKKYSKVIRREHVSPEVHRIITEGLSWWFDHTSDPAEWDKISEYMLFTKLASEPQSTKDIYAKIMESPDSTGVTAEAVLRTLNERLFFSNVAVMAQDISEGLGSYSAEEVKDEVDKYFKSNLTVPKVAMSPSELLLRLKATTATGLRWRLKEMNVSIGDLRKGNLALVAARTEAGKTCFLVSQTVDFLLQSDRPLIYMTNEDPAERILLRYYQSGLGWSHSTVQSDFDAADVAFKAKYGEKLKVLDLNAEEVNSWSHIEQIITAYDPCCVVIDQLRNVRGFNDSGTDVARLKELFTHARGLAARVCPIIVAHQLDGTATGVLYPTENQLEGTKTEVQGALDVQIMLGRSYEPGYEDVRGMNVVKNKLGSGPMADHRYRHGKFELRIDEEHQNFIGVL